MLKIIKYIENMKNKHSLINFVYSMNFSKINVNFQLILFYTVMDLQFQYFWILFYDKININYGFKLFLLVTFIMTLKKKSLENSCKTKHLT